MPASERTLWGYSPTRHIYHALKLLAEGADMDRAVKHLVDSTDFWNLRTSRLAVILSLPARDHRALCLTGRSIRMLWRNWLLVLNTIVVEPGAGLKDA